MKILPPSEPNIAEALSVLEQGGVIAHATETCYGLACDLRNQEAVQKLFAMKNRPSTAPASGLFPDIESTKAYVQWHADAEVLAAQYYPGPITIILPLLDGVRLFPSPDGGQTLGIRISPHEVALALAQGFGAPISTTSANVHGEPNTYSAEEIVAQFSDQDVQPDLILDSGTLEIKDSSTVIDFSTGEMQILRKGDIAFP